MHPVATGRPAPQELKHLHLALERQKLSLDVLHRRRSGAARTMTSADWNRHPVVPNLRYGDVGDTVMYQEGPITC